MIYSHKHSSFASTFPIYLFTQKSIEVPDEEAEKTEKTETDAPTPSPSPESDDETDEDEAIIEETTEETKKDEESFEHKTKTVVVDEWVQLNKQPPIWMRSVLIFSCDILNIDMIPSETLRLLPMKSTSYSIKLRSRTTPSLSLGITSLETLARVFLSVPSSMCHLSCTLHIPAS